MSSAKKKGMGTVLFLNIRVKTPDKVGEPNSLDLSLLWVSNLAADTYFDWNPNLSEFSTLLFVNHLNSTYTMKTTQLKAQISALLKELAKQEQAEKLVALEMANKLFPKSTTVTFLNSDGVRDWEETLLVFHPEEIVIPQTLSFREDTPLWDMEEKGLILILQD